MELQLSADESTALKGALDSYLSDLRMEIVDTDNPSYRRDLRAEQALLAGVLDKIASAAASSERDAEGHSLVRMTLVWVD